MSMSLTRLDAQGYPDEAGLIARAIENDAAAVRLIMQRNNQRLYRIARSVVRDESEAEDVVQEAYGRAFTRLREFRGASRIGTWLGRIVLNEALGRLRRRRETVDWSSIENQHRAQAQIIPFPLVAAQPDPERSMAQREIRELLERAVDDLPDAFRLVLVARAIEGMSIEDTAELLGIRPETVKTRLHRARTLLKAKLEHDIGPSLTESFPFEGERCERITSSVLERLRVPRTHLHPNPQLTGVRAVPNSNPRSTVSFAQHPVHPMLVPFPIAFFVSTFLCDLAFWNTGNEFWATAGLWLLGAGLVMAALAAVVGLVDVLGEARIRQLNDARLHAGGNVVAVLIELYNFYSRYDQGVTAIIPTGTVLSGIVVAILLFTGWKGWELVYRHRVGVADSTGEGSS